MVTRPTLFIPTLAVKGKLASTLRNSLEASQCNLEAIPVSRIVNQGQLEATSNSLGGEGVLI